MAAGPAAAVPDWGRAVVETTMRHHPNPAAFGRWNYPFGLYLYGQYLVFKRTGERRYFRYIKDWVDSHVDAEGNIDQPLTALDRRMPGLLLLILHRETAEPRYRRAAERIRRAFDAHPRTSDGGFWHTNQAKGRLWADGAFMMVPFLIEYGETFPDGGASREEAVRQLLVYARHLQDPATGLLHHAYDEAGRAPWLEPGTRHAQEFWCRAVGWYGMALVHALDGVGNHPRRADLLAVLKKLAAALERYQDPRTGRWFQVMDKGSLPANWTETSCSSMHAYVLARAAAGRHLPPRYADVAARGYQGVLEMISLDREGRVDLAGISAGTSVGSLRFYLARPRRANDPHGLGAFLLMHEQFRSLEGQAAAR